jgi:hypothetical protein
MPVLTGQRGKSCVLLFQANRTAYHSAATHTTTGNLTIYLPVSSSRPEVTMWKARQMNRLTFATIAGGALAALAMGFPASTQAAPSGIGSAQDTVNTLESSGYHVVLNKLGTGPLDLCTVDSVRPGEPVKRPVQPGGAPVNQTAYQTVYLTANC